MKTDWLPEPAGIAHKGEVIFFREGEQTGLWTVVKLGYPEFTKGPMTFEEAKAYREKIK